MNALQNEFLGCTTAIVVETQEQFEVLKQFMGMKNLFMGDGTPAGSMNMLVDNKRIAFYRDSIGMYVAYDHPANCEGYKLCEFDKVFNEVPTPKVEQRSFFGGDDAPGIKQPDEDLVVGPMEADYKEIENEISLKEALNQLTIGTVTPAKCDGNLLEFKDKVIDVINKKENLVITKENFVESKEIVTDLNAKANVLKDQRAAFNKEVKKFTDPYSTAFSEVINAIEKVSKTLKSNIKVFEDKEKEELKKKLYETQFNPMIEMLISKDMISVEISKQFEFKESWLNKTSFTKTGDFVKKVKDEISAEFNRLVKMYDDEKKDIENIKSTIEQLSIAHHLDTKLNADTYITLYKSGVPMPEVNERINQDIATVKRVIENEANKKAQEMASKQQNIQHEQQVLSKENVPPVQETPSNIIILNDEKTGEVVAKGTDKQILVDIGGNKANTNIYQYVYNFSGDVRSMVTFNRFIKLLAKMFNFKAERILQVKDEEHIRLINEFKERAGK